MLWTARLRKSSALAVLFLGADVLGKHKAADDESAGSDEGAAESAVQSFMDALTGAHEKARAKVMLCEGTQEEVLACNVEQCAVKSAGVDGVWGEWSKWGYCSCDGIRERHRSIKKHAKFGGRVPTGPEAQAERCLPECRANLPTDCELAEWSDWSDCSKSCGGGQQTRDRQLVSVPENCGETCTAPLKETRACNQRSCESSSDCSLTKWSEWSKCNKECDGGQQFRTRAFASLADGGGEGCVDVLHETRGCNEQCCHGNEPVDCVWDDWNDWSDCSTKCDGGEKTRDRAIKIAPRNGGKLCDPMSVSEVARCNTDPCNAKSPVPAKWSEWSDWSLCTSACGGGYQFRSRAVAEPARNGGEGLSGDMQEFRTCNTKHCSSNPIDCKFGPWSKLSDCSCPCNGHASKSRRIMQFAQNGGDECSGPLTIVEPCNLHSKACMLQDDADCKFSEWTSWSSCSVKCDGGERTRTRSIAQPARNEGTPCMGQIKQVEECNTLPCCPECSEHRDCKWSEWDEWSTCDAECDGGQRTRFRRIEVQPKNSGKACDAKDSVEIGACNTQRCDATTYCVWSDWTAFTKCDKPCGGGQRRRARHLELTDEAPRDDGGALVSSNTLAAQVADLAEAYKSWNRAIAGAAAICIGSLLVVMVVTRRNWGPVTNSNRPVVSGETFLTREGPNDS